MIIDKQEVQLIKLIFDLETWKQFKLADHQYQLPGYFKLRDSFNTNFLVTYIDKINFQQY